MELARRRAVLWLVAPLLAAVGVVAASTQAEAQSTLRQAAADDFLVGAALGNSFLGNSTYANIAGTEFSSVTAENSMKWDTTEPNPNQFNFGPGNQIVQFAQQNSQQVYGHTLVWHSQTPGWVQNLGTCDQLLAAMRNHITQLLTQWPNVARWDVVNEVIGDNNGQMRDSFWFQRCGTTYIAEAFRAARAADPNAVLCMNDYSIDGMNAKSNAYFTLVQQLLSQGVPINCMGFQAHLILGQVPGDMQQNLQRFANLNGINEVWITELDIRIPEPVDAQELQTQATNFRQVYNVCQNVPDCAGVTVWGVHDAQSWVDSTFPEFDSPLLWDDNFQRKPAYNAVLDELGGGPTQSSPPPSSPPPSSPPPSSPPGPGGCTSTGTVQNQWQTGYVIQPVTVTNTGTASISGWQVSFTLPSGHSVVGSWNAQLSGTAGAINAVNMGYNGNLAPGASTSFGFQASRPNGNTQTPTGYTCSIR